MTRLIGYWAATGVLAFSLLAGGVAYILRPPAIVAGMADLGLPLYITSILGFWKILGAAVLLAPRLPRLKEWAYAGAVFNMTGAVASHINSGNTLGEFVWPLLFAFCALASWALRPASRTLGILLPPASAPQPAVAFQK